MARTGRPKALLELTSDEREQLQRWARRRSSAQALALRSRIVLECAEGMPNKEVAARLGVSQPTVGKWRSRFLELRLDGLEDDPRPGRVPSITAEQVEKIVVDTLESTPKNATHWSRRSMAKKSGLSASTIGRIWHAFELKPHRTDGFKLSNDPMFVEKVYDVAGLYLNPPESAVVLCVDEKSQVQALARSQPAFPMMPEIPAELDIHLVCDNYGTHKTPAIRKWLAEHPRFYMHFTPTYSSWINQVERWFGCITEQLIRRGDHRSVQALEADIRNWIKAWNEDPKPFIWTKTAEQILSSIGRLMQRVNGAAH